MTEPTAQKSGEELILTTPGINYDVPNNNHATVVNLGSNDFEADALAQVRTYVETHGTLKTLTITGHGRTLEMASEEAPDSRSQELRIPNFLEGVKKIQSALGIKIADRIVFDACDTMTNLSANDVSDLRGLAQNLGSQIVGATTVINFATEEAPGSKKEQIGLMAQFNPDGSVRRDQSSATYTEAMAFDFAHLGQMRREQRWGLFYSAFATAVVAAVDGVWGNTPILAELKAEEAKDSTWFACHDGKTQAEGAACQASLLPKERPDSRDIRGVKQVELGPDDGSNKTPKTVPVTVKIHPSLPVP
jgi:hypothetical protein